MTAYQVPVLWCVVQVAIVAGLGAVATWFLSRRAPGAAATAAAGAAATILVVTALAPMPAPRVFEWRTAADVPTDTRAATGNPGRGSALAEGNGVGLDLRALVTRGLVGVGELVRAKPQAASRAGTWLGAAAGAGAVVGLCQLAVAGIYMRRLRRECVRVDDVATCEAFKGVARRLGVRRPVRLCESRELASPAVLGWRRPIVLLPADRAEWTDEQLRATLAHELAHVVRGDFAWRLAASCVRAIHFVHPLVHVLTQRLALAQELAADRLAATAAGGSTNYLRALSELALRLDDRARLRAEPLVLPALSTHLTRRIAMLRSTDGSVDTKRRRLVGVAAAGMIALVGAGTSALRGSAEAVVARSVEAAEASLFSRPAIDLSRLGGLHQGVFVVRLGELSQRPAMAPLFEDARQACVRVWRESFGAESPELDFAAVEYVVGVPQLTIKPAKFVDRPDMTGTMMFGSGELMIRFTRDVAWEAWIERHMPAAERKTAGDLTYFELPAMPALGKERLLAASVDARTVVISLGVERLKAVIAGLPAETSAGEAAQWKSLDGGLIGFVSTDANVHRTMATPKAPRAADILKNVDRYGVGFDLDATTGRAGVRFALACADGAAATETSEAIQELLPQIKAEFERQANALQEKAAAGDSVDSAGAAPISAAELAFKQFWVDAIERCEVQVQSSADRGACVRVEATADFPATLQGMQELAARAPDSVAPESVVR